MRRISLKNCPYCRSSRIYVSPPTTVWQKISVLFLLRLVRCHVCIRRHYRPIFLPAPENPARNKSARKPTAGVPGKNKEKRPA